VLVLLDDEQQSLMSTMRKIWREKSRWRVCLDQSERFISKIAAKSYHAREFLVRQSSSQNATTPVDVEGSSALLVVGGVC